MKALIKDNLVIEKAENEFEVHSDFTWVDCDDSVEVGDSYDGSSFTSNAPTAEDIAAGDLQTLRKERNILLRQTDHWAYQDTPDITAEQTTYRQALRDITDTYSSINEEGFTWPTKPE